MPIPILVWGIGLGVSALYGSVKGMGGVSDLKEAKRIGESAKRRHDYAIEMLNKKREETSKRAEKHGGYIKLIHETTIHEFKEFLENLQKKTNLREIKIPKSANVAALNIKEYQQKILDPQSDLFSAVGAFSAGSAASGTALGAVGLLGTASTGTGIASLSGIAAQNATLAWLGGGTLASGGAGVAGGTLVLGGLAAAPAILIGGWVLASKGEKALTEAKAYEAKAEKSIQNIRTLKEFLEKVEVRIDELDNLLKKLNHHARKSLNKLNAKTFDKNDESDMMNLTITLNMTKALLEVMSTPILDSDGSMTDESKQIQVKYANLEEE